MTNPAATPKFGDLVLIRGDGWDGMPDSPMPYYLGAKDGLFVHRRLLFGRGVARLNNWPTHFKSVGTTTGRFLFEADPIPGQLMAQIVDFFQRTFARLGTESMVLLTMNVETKEWGCFIPTQLVSHGGINYVYDPQHVRRGWIVVGSIHSHADFNPFHSGTDTGDASDFDGFHGTIGYVDKTPKIVAMVSLNKQNMHYGEADFPGLFDWTQLGQHTAPTWWDQYVGKSTEKPVGFELYARFAKPTVIQTETRGYTPPSNVVRGAHGLQVYSGDNYASRQMQSDWGIGRAAPTRTKWWAGRSPSEMIEMGYAWDAQRQDFKYVGRPSKPVTITNPSATRESALFNARQMAERGLNWDSETGALKVTRLSGDAAKNARDYLMGTMGMGELEEPYWEDGLSDDIVTAIVESGCFTEDDGDYAVANPEICGDPMYWKKEFVAKALGAVDVLRTLGVEAKLMLSVHNETTDQTEDWLLPMDTDAPTPTTTAQEVTHGVH